MMLKCLHEVALAGLVVPEGADKATEREILRRRQQVEAQLSLARRAILMLKSLFADVSAMRVDGGDGFQGTGDSEWGIREGVNVTLDWPNLALLTDETKQILDEVAKADVPKIWFVFHGDCSQSLRCEAADREEAMEICADANPGRKIHAAVPASVQGELVMYGYGEDMVHCPLCGSRTDFGELPREGWQVHVCLSCNHSFIAVPEDSEAETARTFAWQGTWTMNQDGRVETQPRVEKTEEGFIPTLAISYAGDEPNFETAEPLATLEEAKTAAETLDSNWHRRETDEVEAETSVVSKSAEDIAEGVSEVIADIAFTAGHLMGTGKLVAFSDSREMMGLIVSWANQFETVFDKDSNGDDYMELVDDYATYRLSGEHDKAEKVLVAMQVMRQVKA